MNNEEKNILDGVFTLWAHHRLIEFLEEQQKRKIKDSSCSYIDYEKIDDISKGYVAITFVNYAHSITHEWAIWSFGRNYESWLTDMGYNLKWEL